ncbi:MAG: hypothetical protein C4516_08655 [Oxalobacter sp.]|nr:MAG: hypothetical protein C4516_08655 [Oxalobacter sp.]
MKAPANIASGRCPSCTRVYQKTPAGYIMLHGDFVLDHRNEILSLIHHIETRERVLDPLKRIMWVEYQQEGVIVTTADIPLTHVIGEALLRAYKGDLDYHFNEAKVLLFVCWKR